MTMINQPVTPRRGAGRFSTPSLPDINQPATPGEGPEGCPRPRCQASPSRQSWWFRLSASAPPVTARPRCKTTRALPTCCLKTTFPIRRCETQTPPCRQPASRPHALLRPPVRQPQAVCQRHNLLYHGAGRKPVYADADDRRIPRVAADFQPDARAQRLCSRPRDMRAVTHTVK